MGETLENHAARVLQSMRPGLPGGRRAARIPRGQPHARRRRAALGQPRGLRLFPVAQLARTPSDSAQKRVLRRSSSRPASTGIPLASRPRPSRRARCPAWLAGEMELSAALPAPAPARARALDPRQGRARPRRSPGPRPHRAAGAARRARGAAGSSRRSGTRDRRTSTRRRDSSRAPSRSRTSPRSWWATPARPRPGETWWDACAGEGGKTLHLSDLMAQQGPPLGDRPVGAAALDPEGAARRAPGCSTTGSAVWTGTGPAPFKTKCDGVLVDAPCSGVGTWQRNPHARWTTTLEDVRRAGGRPGGAPRPARRRP